MTSQSIRTDATDEELAESVHENLWALFRSMQILPGAEVVESEFLSYHHAFPNSPMFKGVWKTRLVPEDIEIGIDRAIAWFNQRGASDFLWWTDSQTQPADLANHLLKRGFDGNLEGDLGMALDLKKLKEDSSAPAGFRIVKAFDQKTLEDWRDVFNASNEQPATAG